MSQNNNQKQVQKHKEKKTVIALPSLTTTVVGILTALLTFVVINYMLPVAEVRARMDSLLNSEIKEIKVDIQEIKKMQENMQGRLSDLEKKVIILEYKVENK